MASDIGDKVKCGVANWGQKPLRCQAKMQLLSLSVSHPIPQVAYHFFLAVNLAEEMVFYYYLFVQYRLLS